MPDSGLPLRYIGPMRDWIDDFVLNAFIVLLRIALLIGAVRVLAFLLL